MKNLNKLIVATLVLTVFFINVNAQVSASASATATVVTPIAMTNVLDMSFGNISVNAVAGTVVMTPASGRTITGGVTLPATTGLVQAATFDVTGTGTYTYGITLPSTPVTLTHTNGTDVMTATTFTSTPSGTGALTAGAQTIAVGATLNVAALQLAGVYTTPTEFIVTINYN